MTDLTIVPLVALSNATKESISNLLNPRKFIPSDDGLPRDWRGLAHLSGIGGEVIPNLSSKPDPCGFILTKMQEKAQGFTFADFQTLLERLDRWDIVDDTMALMEKDAESYKQRSERLSASPNAIENDVDDQILTCDDSYGPEQGLEKQYYDAFLLFADEDVDFADEITENLEKKSGLKLCRKDRDFVIGLPFEHTATMTLISERCNRLLVIVSPNFLKSSANKFFLSYAQALGIDKRQRKIIPCLYQKCTLPPELSYYFILDYNRAGKLWDFWGRLRDSVKTPGTSSGTSRTTPAAPSAEKSDNSKVVCVEETKKCCKVEEVCELSAEMCEPKVKCEVENLEDKTKTVGEKKNKGLLKRFRMKKYSRQQQVKVECSLTELNTSESLPSLTSSSFGSSFGSSFSLSDTGTRKKNFVNKYVNKVRAMMKS